MTNLKKILISGTLVAASIFCSCNDKRIEEIMQTEEAYLVRTEEGWFFHGQVDFIADPKYAPLTGNRAMVVQYKDIFEVDPKDLDSEGRPRRTHLDYQFIDAWPRNSRNN